MPKRAWKIYTSPVANTYEFGTNRTSSERLNRMIIKAQLDAVRSQVRRDSKELDALLPRRDASEYEVALKAINVGFSGAR